MVIKSALRAALMALILSAGSALAASTAEVTFDLRNAHVFSGFGVQAWPTHLNQAARDQVLRQLRVHFVRLGTSVKLPADALQPGESVANILASLHSAEDSTSGRQTMADLADELNSLNISVDAVVWEMPSPWRREVHWRDSSGARTSHFAAPERTQDYANYITAQLLYAANLGFNLHFVELSNEPDGSWNTKWDPHEYARLVELARRALDANGLGYVRIEGPGTGTERAAAPFIRALVDDGEISRLGAISVHDWDSRKIADPEGLIDQFRAAMSDVPPNVPLRVTEYNDENPRWSQPPYASGPTAPDNGNSSADTPEFGLVVASSVLKLLAQGAEAVSLWQIQDLSWQPTSMGLVDLQGRIRPDVPALSTFLQLAQPGSKVSEGTSTDPQLVSAAFTTANTIVVTEANLGSDALDVQAALPLSLYSPRIVTAKIYSTAGGQFTVGELASVSAQRLTIHLPAGSIVAVELRQ